ncbi:reverse transcriptase domain-containing protein [Tanacetum coccineum]
MDDPNITMEEYIRLEEEKARRHGQTFNWQTAMFEKVENYEDGDDCSIDFETKFPAIVFDNTLTKIPFEPMACPPNENEVDFKISLDESDDEDYTLIFDENSFSYKIISVNDLKTNSGNDKPLSPNPTVDYFDDLDNFKDFKNEFPAIVYNDGLTSKSDLEIKPLIMPPRMRTRSAGRPAAKSLGGGTGVRVGRGGRGRRPREGNDERVDDLNGQGNDQGLRANGGVEGVNGNVEGVNGGVGGAPDFSTIIAQQLQNLLPAMLAQVGNQGNVGNQNGNVVNENVQENIGNVIVNGNRVGCSYKEFLACNPKEYDGKGGVVVLTRWIEKMEYIRTLSQEVAVSISWNDFKFMMIEEFYPSHEMQKLESELWNHAMVGAVHAAYTDRFHKLARKVKKRGNVGEPSKDKNGRDDNKRIKTRNAFASTANPVGRENTGLS